MNHPSWWPSVRGPIPRTVRRPTSLAAEFDPDHPRGRSSWILQNVRRLPVARLEFFDFLAQLVEELTDPWPRCGNDRARSRTAVQAAPQARAFRRHAGIASDGSAGPRNDGPAGSTADGSTSPSAVGSSGPRNDGSTGSSVDGDGSASRFGDELPITRLNQSPYSSQQIGNLIMSFLGCLDDETHAQKEWSDRADRFFPVPFPDIELGRSLMSLSVIDDPCARGNIRRDQFDDRRKVRCRLGRRRGWRLRRVGRDEPGPRPQVRRDRRRSRSL